jgi:hypothetical protein
VQADKLYLVFDPSLVQSAARFRAGAELFRAISSSAKEAKVVVPSQLLEVLRSLAQNQNLSESSVQLLSGWRPSADEMYFSRLREFSSYARRFIETCRPVAASELIGDMERIGERTITRDTFLNVGRVLRNAVFEVLAVAHKFKARILTFGERLVNLLYRARILVFSLHHRLKDELKTRSHTRTALKIGIWVLSAGVANVVVGLIPGIPAGDLDVILHFFATLAPALLADRIEDAVERGVMVFLDGTVFYPPNIGRQK